MSHKIEKFDRGVVHGTTWHRMEQYKTQDTPVTREQAIEVLDYPLEKVPLHRLSGSHIGHENGAARQLAEYTEVPGAHAIVRPDHNIVLVPMVGDRFKITPNKDLFDFVDESLLKNNPALEIESVGTLRNGATSFVNVKIQEWAVAGDKSGNITRIAYVNPLGEGSYKVMAHNVRIVCWNTVQMATSEGRATGTLTNIRHTMSADGRILAALTCLAETYAALDNWKEFMADLTRQPVNDKQVVQFLDQWIPLPEDEDSRAYTIADAKRLRVNGKFWDGDDAIKDVQHTKYGLWNAVTWSLDHVPEGSTKDQTAVAWDGIYGDRAKQKLEALPLVVAL